MSKRFSRAVRSGFLVGTSVLLLVANVAIVSFAGFESNVFQDSYANAEKVHYLIWSLLIGVLNAETGVRGYLITGDEIYLGSYHTGVQSVNDQMRAIRLLPLDEIQRAEAADLVSLTNKQLEELASLVEQQRTQGRDVAGLRFKTGTDKVGLDTLRSFIDRATGDMAGSIIVLQHRSKNYREITAYCVLFGAFWIYVIILLASRRPRGAEQ